MTNGRDRPARVTAVVLAFAPRKELGIVLDELERLPVDEVLVVENAPAPAVEGRERPDGSLRVLRPGRNTGVAGRNLAAREAKGELLLMLDDDSYPLPGAVEALTEAFRREPRLGAAGGLVQDVDLDRGTAVERGLGTFDWWLRGGRDDLESETGMPAFFFPEGACMVRRQAFLEIGGFFEPYFLTCVEIDLATRLLANDWDVRYVPSARFAHLKSAIGREKPEMLRLRVRNQIWYFYRHFPAALAARRVTAYLLFDLVESAKSRALSSWALGLRSSWRERALVKGTRRPLPRSVVRRAELNRGRLHLRLLAGRLARLGRA